MKAVIKAVNGTWRDVADCARTTVNKEEGKGDPSSSWKRKILLAEHSPIRRISVNWKWYDLKRWVSDHFVRHKLGIEHWVKTDRTDRTGVNRDDLSQSSLTNHECQATAQALINISRKRLCMQASAETQQAWREVINEVRKVEPELASVCVRECVYRGFCPEMQCCGYVKTKEFREELAIYRGDV